MSKSKGPTVKASTATSGFNGAKTFNSNVGGFGGSTSTINNGVQSTDTQLAQPLQNINNQAQTGISQNQQFINQTPDQQLQNLNAGGNSYYNAQKAMNDKANETARSSAQSQFSADGMDNSTAYGAFQGQQAANNNLQDMQTRQNALQYGNQQATQNIASNAGLMDQLNGYATGMGQQSNQSQTTGLGAQDQIRMFNAGQTQSAQAANVQAATARHAANMAFWGNAIGAGGNVGAAMAMA